MTERYARAAYWIAAWLFVACVVLQVLLVGVDIFMSPDVADRGSIHRDFAYLYGWLTPALLLLSSIGRLPFRQRLLTGGLLVLFAVQTLLPSLSLERPILGGFHGVNALVILWLAITIARGADPAWYQLRSQGG